MHIVVTQTYVPAYRAPLFEALVQLARADGHTLEVITGQPSRDQAARGDASSSPWQRSVAYPSLRLFGRTVIVRTLKLLPYADLYVTELDPGNLLAWQFALRRRRAWLAWGQGKSYTTKPLPGSNWARRYLASRANVVMTYSPGGRDFLIKDRRVNPTRVVAIGNSTDTAELRAHAGPANSDLLSESGPHALFVGGLDPAKRIGFLLEAATRARELDSRFRITIVGRGPLNQTVDEFCRSHTWATKIERARGADLARIAESATALWMPGRVGLVAVDALALGLPLHTTAFEFHAPEIEFLTDGSSLAYLPNSPGAFGEASLGAMSHLPRFVDSNPPSTQKVADAFYKSVIKALEFRR